MTNLLLKLDISGVQDFIYNISSSLLRREAGDNGKYLKARSRWLVEKTESWSQEFADLLTSGEVEFAGGGGAFVIFTDVNAEDAKSLIQQKTDEINDELIAKFGVDLYLSFGIAQFEGEQPTNEVYREVSRANSAKKLNRYSIEQLRKLNSLSKNVVNRRLECSFCRSQVDLVESDDDVRCKFCSDLLLNEGLRVRSFNALSKKAIGIERLGVLRLDVDNLGQAFIDASPAQTKDLSKNMSEFFSEKKLTQMFASPRIKPISGDDHTQRACEVIYAGGDDVFVVGAWNDVLEFAIELRTAFVAESKTWHAITSTKPEGLTLSAGIGVFHPNEVILTMATKTGVLEDAAKHHIDSNAHEKDALALFDPKFNFGWSEFDELVLDKFKFIKSFIQNSSGEKGTSFIYNMYHLIQVTGDEAPISFARLVYLLARLEPTDRSKLPQFKDFSKQMSDWARGDEKTKQSLELALMLFVYQNRKKINPTK